MSDASKITLFVMTLKGLNALETIARDHSDLIDLVVCARDRGLENDHYDDIKGLCRSIGVQFSDRKDPYEVKTKYAFAVSWRWILPIEGRELIILHDSLLPKLRGFNPLVTALINGETEIGVTALFASREFDRGDIIAQSKSRISYPITIDAAINTVMGNYSELLIRICDMLKTGGELPRMPQDDRKATYSLWRDELDYRINWSLSAAEIRRAVDALGYPYKGASTLIDGELYRVLEVEELDDVRIENRTPGKALFISDGLPVVAAGQGLVKIRSLVLASTGSSALPLRSMRTRFT